jgi:hypothetical protein
LLLANYAVEALESLQVAAMHSWTTGTTTGAFTADGYSTIRYTATRSDAPANGGLTNQLMHIQVTVFDDANGNSTCDSGELAVRFRTKIAKLNTYQSLAN